MVCGRLPKSGFANTMLLRLGCVAKAEFRFSDFFPFAIRGVGSKAELRFCDFLTFAIRECVGARCVVESRIAVLRFFTFPNREPEGVCCRIDFMIFFV